MMFRNTTTVVAAALAGFSIVVLVGGAVQASQDARASVGNPGFIPSSGQINLGFDPKVPSSTSAREIPTDAESRKALLASEQSTASFGREANSDEALSEADTTVPPGATPQTMPAKFSSTNDVLDRTPTMAWPLELSYRQRRDFYQAIMADNNAPATDAGSVKLASELPTNAALNEMHALPALIADIGRLRGLKYVKTKDKAFLVSPANRIVVGELSG